MSQQNCKYRRKTRERGAHAECGKSYEISLPATLTGIFMRKSNVRIGGRGPHFGSNSPPYGAKLQSNQPGVYPGDGQFWITVEPLGTNTSLMRTPLYYGHLSNTDTSLLRTVSYVPTKFSYIFSKKKPLKYGSSLIRTTDTKSRPSGANLYKINLFITATPRTGCR